MKTKNILIPLITAIVGIFIGYLVFSNDNGKVEEAHNHDAVEKTTEIWTCSMHPQIRKNEPGDCPICGMTLIPADNGGAENEFILEMSDEAVRLSNIQTTVLSGSVDNNGTLELSGKIQENEENAASLVTQIAGRIEKLYVSFTGEQVNKGQRI